MKVLIFTPTFHVAGVEQLRPETERSIRALAWDGTLDWEVGWHNPYDDGRRNVLAQYQRARRVFLKGKWEALLTVEHDMLVPPDALLKLAAAGADVAYGVYVLRHGSQVINAWQKQGDEDVGDYFVLHPGGALERYLKNGEIVEVSGIGLGCTLIRRNVLKEIEFHEYEKVGSPIPDIPFAQDCLRSGFKQVAHFGVICGHIDDDGTVLWPPGKGWTKMANVRVKILVTFDIDGKRYQGGSELPMGYAQAHELEKSGRVRIIGLISEPAVRVLNIPDLPARKSVKRRKVQDDE